MMEQHASYASDLLRSEGYGQQFFQLPRDIGRSVGVRVHRLHRPTPENCFVLRCLLQLLHPFDAVTEELSGGEYPTIAMTIPALKQIKRHLLKIDIFDNEIINVAGYKFADQAITMMHQVRQTFLASFISRFSNMGSKLTWISYLDPRLTDMVHLRPEQKAQAQEALVEAATQVNIVQSAPIPPPVERPPPSSTPQKIKLDVRMGMYGNRAVEFAHQPTTSASPCSQSTQSVCELEFQKYLEASKLVRAKSDPLQWWKAHSSEFPRLAQLARRWLGCAATSVPSERAFSTSGRVVTAHRCSLRQGLVRDTVFIATNTNKKRRKKTKKMPNKPQK